MKTTQAVKAGHLAEALGTPTYLYSSMNTEISKYLAFTVSWRQEKQRQGKAAWEMKGDQILAQWTWFWLPPLPTWCLIHPFPPNPASLFRPQSEGHRPTNTTQFSLPAEILTLLPLRPVGTGAGLHNAVNSWQKLPHSTSMNILNTFLCRRAAVWMVVRFN